MAASLVPSAAVAAVTISRAVSPVSFAAGGGTRLADPAVAERMLCGLTTPPKKTNSLNAPDAPKKNPKDALREAIKRMNEAHP